MSAGHMHGRLVAVNQYAIPELRTQDGGTLVAALTAHQDKKARRLAACWNACEGITTDELVEIAATGGMLGPREDVARIAAQRDHFMTLAQDNGQVIIKTACELADMKAQRDELLEALKVLHARYVQCIGNEGPEALAARALIAKHQQPAAPAASTT